MLRLGQERDEVAVVADQRGSPTYVGHLAEATRELLEPPHGVWHVAADGDCTWADFAEAIFDEAGLDCRVRRITTAEFGAPAPRPAYSVLRSERGAPATALARGPSSLPRAPRFRLVGALDRTCNPLGENGSLIAYAPSARFVTSSLRTSAVSALARSSAGGGDDDGDVRCRDDRAQTRGLREGRAAPAEAHPRADGCWTRRLSLDVRASVAASQRITELLVRGMPRLARGSHRRCRRPSSLRNRSMMNVRNSDAGSPKLDLFALARTARSRR